MQTIEPFQYAPEWLQKLALKITAVPRVKPKAVAFIRIYEPDTAAQYPSMRDRTAEYERMLEALAEVPHGANLIEVYTGTGADIRKLDVGFEPVGAQFTQTFRLLII